MGTPYMGEVKIISWNFAPQGWAFCNGQLLPINQNQALFSILGTMYGGNGQTTFALPNLQGRMPLHFGNGFNEGQVGGETAHTLNIQELPAHVHGAGCNPGTGTVVAPLNNTWAANTQNSYSAASDAVMRPDSLANTGGSQPHNNMPPYLVLNFIIALVGVFPSRN